MSKLCLSHPSLPSVRSSKLCESCVAMVSRGGAEGVLRFCIQMYSNICALWVCHFVKRTLDTRWVQWTTDINAWKIFYHNYSQLFEYFDERTAETQYTILRNVYINLGQWCLMCILLRAHTCTHGRKISNIFTCVRAYRMQTVGGPSYYPRFGWSLCDCAFMANISAEGSALQPFQLLNLLESGSAGRILNIAGSCSRLRETAEA